MTEMERGGFGLPFLHRAVSDDRLGWDNAVVGDLTADAETVAPVALVPFQFSAGIIIVDVPQHVGKLVVVWTELVPIQLCDVDGKNHAAIAEVVEGIVARRVSVSGQKYDWILTDLASGRGP